MKLKFKGDGKNPTLRDCVDMHDFLSGKKLSVPNESNALHEKAKNNGYKEPAHFGKVPVVESKSNLASILIMALIILIGWLLFFA